MIAHKCPTCGSSVRVVGETTMHYEPADKVEMEKKKQEWIGRYKSREGRAIARRGWEAAVSALARLKELGEEK